MLRSIGVTSSYELASDTFGIRHLNLPNEVRRVKRLSSRPI